MAKIAAQTQPPESRFVLGLELLGGLEWKPNPILRKGVTDAYIPIR